MMVIVVGLFLYNVVLFYLVNYVFYKGFLFLGVGVVIYVVVDN